MKLSQVFRGRNRKPKVFVVGLDCAAPELVFDRWRDDLPNLTSLRNQGRWGELQSSIPAITVPAWSSMLSGRDPGEIGIYGFRNRADHSYDGRFIATQNYVTVRRIWDYLTEADLNSVVIGVPQTYPVRPMKGTLISGFLAPGTKSEFTYPSSLKDELLAVAPGYEVDVPQFRTDDKGWLLEQIWDMTRNRIKAVDYLVKEKPWDFFMVMEIGVDRIHHGFWSYHDPLHRRYEPGNAFESAIHDYYVYLDSKIGEWVAHLDDDTVILVVSDHGAQRMDGGICLNEWLWHEGYLVFESDPPAGRLTRLDDLEIDWERTRAWGDGGYYGRLFVNVEGREPNGAVPADELQAFLADLEQRLIAIPGPNGEDLGTKIYRPSNVYKQVKGVAPDLMIYFGDLLWRSVGTLGHGGVHTFENDTGPDDCNHAENGLFILRDPGESSPGALVRGAQLMDVTPTLLGAFGLSTPPEIQGVGLMERMASLSGKVTSASEASAA